MTDPIAGTTHGRVRGRAGPGAVAFRGIPYGGPTHDRRFRPPVPPASWTGVRDAVEFGPVCPQPRIAAAGDSLYAEQERLRHPAVHDSYSEDCLNLNVVTPAIDDAARPVMVWLHGGGYMAGSANMPTYDGTMLARRHDVVTVTINHRLGPFGYLDLRDTSGDLAHSSIAGVLDLILALEWVRDNIGAFGGNPDNIMIFGHSSGAHEVCTLMGMPSAQGLFHKAATLTGFGVRVAEPDHTLRMAHQLMKHLGVSAGDLNALEALDPDILAGAPPKIGIQLRPSLDDTHLPSHPFDPAAPAAVADMPMIIGTCWDEMTFLATGDPGYPQMDDMELLRRLQARHGDKAREIIRLYKSEHPDLTPPRIYARAMSEGYRAGAYDLAERKLAKGAAPVFLYLFAYQSDALHGLLGATHGVEIPFIFETVDSSGLTGQRPDRHDVASVTSGMFATFARTGIPAADGAPTWPRWTPEERAAMLIDVDCRVEHDPCGDEVRLVTT